MVENTQVAEDRQFSLVSPQGHMKSTTAFLNSPAHLSSRDSSLLLRYLWAVLPPLIEMVNILYTTKS